MVKRDMQDTRLKLLDALEEVFNKAKAYVERKNVSPKQKQIWIRVMAYTGQTMNSITKSFDESEITESLQRLEKMINEAVAKEEVGGSGRKSRSPSGG